MKVRDVERLLAGHGVGKAKMDAVTRLLRGSRELPIEGRGANAADVNALDAAKILISVAGSSRAASAYKRLKLLRNLRSDGEARLPLLPQVARLLEQSSELERVLEIRVGRNVREASLVFQDGSVERFIRSAPRDYSSRLRVEGTIPVKLLKEVSAGIKNRISVPEAPPDAEPDSD